MANKYPTAFKPGLAKTQMPRRGGKSVSFSLAELKKKHPGPKYLEMKDHAAHVCKGEFHFLYGRIRRTVIKE